MANPPIAAFEICAVVLAGGRGMRMGGVDKGLQLFQGQALAMRAVQRLQAQTAGAPGLIGINANRHLEEYAAWGFPVWQDTLADFAGPLAGFASALAACQAAPSPFKYLLTVPCDSPGYPLDLMARLSETLLESQADIAMTVAPDSEQEGAPVMRRQPVFCLMQTNVRNSLGDYLNQGGRKIAQWAETLDLALATFDRPTDDPQAFFNANTLDQLHQIESP
jgi:molybdopterin-guanine dinucleotide biosynthesis protein A